MHLRPYQLETISAVRSGWDEFRRQLCVLPTGAGKTVIAAHIAAEHAKECRRVLFLAHREELLLQTIDKFRRAANLNGSLEKAENYASLSAPVVVGSVQTFTSRGYRFAEDHFGLVIVDEAHHVLADSYRKVLDLFPKARVLGITATPDRGDKRNLGMFFENISTEVKLFDLVHQGYLSPIAVKAVPLNIDLRGVHQTGGDWDAGELGDRLEPLLGQIAEAIREHASFRRVLCFLPLIATSQKFVEACRAAGLSAAHVDGNSPDRRVILERFASGDFDVLSNAMLLTEGYDDPGIDCVVVLRPTRSRPLYAQMVGRGTRTAAGKDHLLLLDFLWMHERHTLIRPAHLIAETDDQAAVMTEIAERERSGQELDLEAVAGEATKEREEALRKKLAEHKNRAAVTISAEEFALQHGSLEAAEFEPVMEWERQMVTDKQAWLLKRNKIDLESVRGKGHASRLIALIKRDEAVTLASPAQRWKMRQMGHPNAHQATAAEARQFFAGLRKPFSSRANGRYVDSIRG